MIPARRQRRFARAAAFLLCGAAWLAGCASTREKQEDAFYGPTESILEVVSVLRRHVPDDTYRFEPGTDFTGRNVYRSSLLRLESLERIHAGALRSGYLDDVILFAKARALERLRAFDLAADHYRQVAREAGSLQEEARFSAHICSELDKAKQIGLDLSDPVGRNPTPSPLPADPDAVLADLDERVSVLADLHERAVDSHYVFVIREEVERADVTRARYFVAMRSALEAGHLRAVSELQRVLDRHSASKNRRRHMLNLANLYVQLAEEYVAAVPPESLDFDPPKFQELVQAATRIYQTVSAQDGTAEKLEAARRLEAFIAFALRIDRDRFSQ